MCSRALFDCNLHERSSHCLVVFSKGGAKASGFLSHYLCLIIDVVFHCLFEQFDHLIPSYFGFISKNN